MPSAHRPVQGVFITAIPRGFYDTICYTGGGGQLQPPRLKFSPLVGLSFNILRPACSFRWFVHLSTILNHNRLDCNRQLLTITATATIFIWHFPTIRARFLWLVNLWIDIFQTIPAQPFCDLQYRICDNVGIATCTCDGAFFHDAVSFRLAFILNNLWLRYIALFFDGAGQARTVRHGPQINMMRPALSWKLRSVLSWSQVGHVFHFIS